MKSIKLLYSLLRRKYWTFRVKAKVGSINGKIVANGPTYLTKHTHLGDNVNFNGLKVIGMGSCFIGNNFHSGSGCVILTHYHNYDRSTRIPYDNSYIIKDVQIGDNVWLGINVIILPGIIIEEGAVIQAGSVVVNNIPKCGIAGGHPAKVFKYRDLNSYNELKNNKMFF